MSAGGPGDHPLTDVLNWGIPIYGATPDAELRNLAVLLSQRELVDWWESEVGWNASNESAATIISNKLIWAQTRAKANGWEPA